MVYFTRNVKWRIIMTKYVFNRCKKYTWLLLLITLIWTTSTMASQYIYKFIGFAIDYGLNYQGKPYTGEFSFLFNGHFGEYGTLSLILTLAILCLAHCFLIFVDICHLIVK